MYSGERSVPLGALVFATAEWILTNLDRTQVSNALCLFVFFVPIGNPRWPPWPLIGRNIFHFFTTTELILMKLVGTQVIYQIYESSSMMAAMAFDGLECFFNFFSATAVLIMMKDEIDRTSRTRQEIMRNNHHISASPRLSENTGRPVRNLMLILGRLFLFSNLPRLEPLHSRLNKTNC